MKPTKEMIEAGANAARKYMEETGGNDLAVIWEAMWEARPKEQHAKAIHTGFDWLDNEQLVATYAVPVETNLRTSPHILINICVTSP